MDEVLAILAKKRLLYDFDHAVQFHPDLLHGAPRVHAGVVPLGRHGGLVVHDPRGSLGYSLRRRWHARRAQLGRGIKAALLSLHPSRSLGLHGVAGGPFLGSSDQRRLRRRPLAAQHPPGDPERGGRFDIHLPQHRLDLPEVE